MYVTNGGNKPLINELFRSYDGELDTVNTPNNGTKLGSFKNKFYLANKAIFLILNWKY